MKKFKKGQVFITILAIGIAVAGYINYSNGFGDIVSVSKKTNSENVLDGSNSLMYENESPADEQESVDEQSLQEPGSAILTAGENVSGIISEAKINREQVRSKNKEMLLEIINNDKMDDKSKQQAVNKIATMTDISEKEMAAELLLEAKGFNECVVSMLDNGVDVVVNAKELSDVQRAQVEDIIKRKTGTTADKISINICNN